MAFELYPKNQSSSTYVPSFPFESVGYKGEIDLREEMKIILEGGAGVPRRGHWVLLRRMHKRQRCFCWDQQATGEEQFINDRRKYDEARLRCPVCHGEGWVYEEELYLVRRRLVSPEIGLASSETMSDIGWMNMNYILYYMQYYVNPSKDDKIFEIEQLPNGDPKRPFIKTEQYNIAVAEPFRDINGRVEFWRVAAKTEAV